nr:hypothetical protein [Tanacetum cinerariifolium]
MPPRSPPHQPPPPLPPPGPSRTSGSPGAYRSSQVLPPHPPPPSTTRKRIGELEQIMANLIQDNKHLKKRLESHGARLYTLENIDIPQK